MLALKSLHTESRRSVPSGGATHEETEVPSAREPLTPAWSPLPSPGSGCATMPRQNREALKLLMSEGGHMRPVRQPSLGFFRAGLSGMTVSVRGATDTAGRCEEFWPVPSPSGSGSKGRDALALVKQESGERDKGGIFGPE